MQLSVDDLFEKFPHEDGIAPHHHLVEDFPFVAVQLERLLQGHIHEHIHPDNDPLDLSASVELDAELLCDVLVEVWRVSLLGEWSFHG